MSRERNPAAVSGDLWDLRWAWLLHALYGWQLHAPLRHSLGYVLVEVLSSAEPVQELSRDPTILRIGRDKRPLQSVNDLALLFVSQ